MFKGLRKTEEKNKGTTDNRCTHTASNLFLVDILVQKYENKVKIIIVV